MVILQYFKLRGKAGFEFRACRGVAFVALRDEPPRAWGSGAIGHRLTVPVTDKPEATELLSCLPTIRPVLSEEFD